MTAPGGRYPDPPQTQLVVPSQRLNVPWLRQLTPGQHGCVAEHGWSMREHELKLQAQLVDPAVHSVVASAKQPSPLQHSLPAAVQLCPMSWHAGAGAVQVPFRHWSAASQHGTVPEQL